MLRLSLIEQSIKDANLQRCALSLRCTFSHHFIWIKPWSLFRAFAIITLKKLFQALWSCSIILFRSGSRTAATSKMERFVIIVNGWKPLTIITKCSILDVAVVLDPPLLFVLIYVEELKNIKVQHNVQLWRFVHMLNFLKLIKFTALFHFSSSDQSEMVDWLKRFLTRSHINPRLKTVTKTFLKKVQHKSTTC